MDLVLDVDTGVDDALALLLAVRHPELTVRAVTCVRGNASLDQVVRNTLNVLDAAGAPDLPVAAGARRPLIAEPHDAGHVHGKDGLADLGLPDPARRPDPRHAVELLRDVVTAAEDRLTLVALAPLTNVALFVRTYPDLARQLARIVVMGGSAGVGNASPVAEFNTWHDPEAAAIVLDAGVPVTMYGLDVFYQPAVDSIGREKLAAAGNPAADLATRLLQHALGNGEPRVPAGGAPLGDAGAVCSLLHPDGLVTGRFPVHVELAPGRTRGQTVVDRRAQPGEQEIHGLAGTGAPLVDVALEVDGPGYGRLFVDTLLGVTG
ncbi:nucleoside hydrolase [Amycolatopsis jejuensis]|uniref:nucleoside hydrolase n=1 Tax=Amycolatopsis jejuensis TaxID=330084 RepID=UPI0005264A6D|nr:nucleoside hydrolase [Amycolatopsis jejuensis]